MTSQKCKLLMKEMELNTSSNPGQDGVSLHTSSLRKSTNPAIVK